MSRIEPLGSLLCEGFPLVGPRPRYRAQAATLCMVRMGGLMNLRCWLIMLRHCLASGVPASERVVEVGVFGGQIRYW